MRYVTGIHALNIPCSLDTCGDWHQFSIQWDKPRLRESIGSFFGDYGIEKGVKILGSEAEYNVANHIRALLDLLEEGNFSIAQGMKEDFICNDSYTNEIFSKISMMTSLPKWNEIDRFMTKEYYSEWSNFKKG